MRVGSRLLGIDPGFTTTGYSIIVVGLSQKVTILEYNFLALPSSKTLAERVQLFYDFFKNKIIEFQLTDIAIETPFLGKNAQNFLKLGYLRGTIYLLSAQHALQLHEFSPTQVKQAVVGNGGAQKEQVAAMIYRLFPRIEKCKKLDVTDAIAVSLCATWHQKRLL